MSSKNLEIIVTKDGSHSIFNPALNETYHSVGGAIHESEYIYIDQGFKKLASHLQRIKILEVGFGTGLNAILSLREGHGKSLDIDYLTLEPYPLSKEITEQLNYPSVLNDPFITQNFQIIHSCPWEEEVLLIPGFTFQKRASKLEDFETDRKFDLIYYDAFAPSKQSEIWDLKNLEKIKSMMSDEGILITYCSSGKFKRDLKEIGFRIESLPGPMGKREITRASNLS